MHHRAPTRRSLAVDRRRRVGVTGTLFVTFVISRGSKVTKSVPRPFEKTSTTATRRRPDAASGHSVGRRRAHADAALSRLLRANVELHHLHATTRVAASTEQVRHAMEAEKSLPVARSLAPVSHPQLVTDSTCSMPPLESS
jgi:hypothetical protein